MRNQIVVFTLMVALGSCGIACRVESPVELDVSGDHDVQFLDQRLVTSGDISLFPGRHWNLSEDKSCWTFRGEARTVVWVQSETQSPLKIDFETTGATERFHFTFSWDGAPLELEARFFADGAGTLEIDPALLTEGVHFLILKRDIRKDAPDDRALHDNQFRSVSYRNGEHSVVLGTDDLERLRYIGSLLEMGVTGSTNTKRSGFLFDGPRSFVINLRIKDGGLLTFDVENVSSKKALFGLSAGAVTSEVWIGGGESEIIELAVEQGVSTLRFEVSGAEDGLFMWGGSRMTVDEEPNLNSIVLITLDTTRRDVLSPYGGPAPASPHLEAFAEHATVFENAFATSPWTLPSHASMMTGLYPTVHAAGVTTDWIAPDHKTLAALLRRGGYYNAGFAGGEMCASRWGVGRSFQLYQDPEGFESTGDVLNAGAFSVLRTIGSDPLFLFVNYFDPHGLYRAPQRFQELFDVEGREIRLAGQEIWQKLAKGNGAAWGDIIEGKAVVTQEALEFLRAAYLAEVAFMDEQIGLLFEELKQRGLYDSALIIVVADHGELLGEGGFFSHACRLDPELVEVPLMIKWPHQKKGERSDLLVSHVDIFATILREAGIDAPPNDGFVIDQDENVEIGQRSMVFMEEHESRIHPLFANMKIAKDLYGLQQISHREVVWKGGLDCFSRKGAGWTSIPCEGSWEESLAHLGAMAAGMNERRQEVQRGTLSDDERHRLEALGYIN